MVVIKRYIYLAKRVIFWCYSRRLKRAMRVFECLLRARVVDDFFFFVANVVKKSRFLSFPVWLKIVDDDRVSSKRDTGALCGGAHHKKKKKNSPLITKQSVMRGEGARVHKKKIAFFVSFGRHRHHHPSAQSFISR